VKSRPVDFFKYDEDFECVYMGALGFSTRGIQFRLGSGKRLTAGQIAYRLKKANVRRADYRNGDSEFAVMAYTKLRSAIAPAITRDLKR
jgi:hypothetical protein